MNLFGKIAAKFTTRGRALARVNQGMDCANKAESELAIKHCTDIIKASEPPCDILAMALLNRALVYTTIGQERQATVDLKAILKMPEATTRIE